MFFKLTQNISTTTVTNIDKRSNFRAASLMLKKAQAYIYTFLVLVRALPVAQGEINNGLV